MISLVRPLFALALWTCGGIGAVSMMALTPVNTHAASAEAATRGEQLFREAEARDSGWQDLEVSLTMNLRSSGGRVTSRELRIRQLEVPDDGDRVLVVFDTPASVRGTALLSHSHVEGPDDQWLFLPALKRVKKIASRNKTGPFLGSEFTFEDLAAQPVEKFTYAYMRDDELDGRRAHVIDRFPIDEFSGYASQRVWLDAQRLTIERIEFSNRRGEVVKVLTVDGYAQFADRYWRAARMQMENLRSDKSTELVWYDYRFGIGLSADRDFSVNSLRRAR